MRRTYWSIPALLLAGAVVWAQQPGRDTFNDASLVSEDVPGRPPSRTDPAISVSPPAPAPSRLQPSITENSPDMMMNPVPSNPMKAKQVQRTVIETQYVPLSKAELDEFRIYQAAVATLKSDEPADKKELARKQLFELLSVGFDRDLESRESDLKDLESRVQKLRGQLDKRKAAKQEIIDLRLKTIQNEAEGLEYPGAGNNSPQIGLPIPSFAPREPEPDEFKPTRRS